MRAEADLEVVQYQVATVRRGAAGKGYETGEKVRACPGRLSKPYLASTLALVSTALDCSQQPSKSGGKSGGANLAPWGSPGVAHSPAPPACRRALGERPNG
ncbi:hypothetical protein J6590_051978 [Homalodisca vitripennis]|nr:hypothetical protein J6590_051978 [Homalodisca vitripennis]